MAGAGDSQVVRILMQRLTNHVFPVAERVGKQIVSLPMFYAMNEADVERTCKAMVEVLVR